MDSHIISSLIGLLAEASFLWQFVMKVHR